MSRVDKVIAIGAAVFIAAGAWLAWSVHKEYKKGREMYGAIEDRFTKEFDDKSGGAFEAEKESQEAKDRIAAETEGQSQKEPLTVPQKERTAASSEERLGASPEDPPEDAPQRLRIDWAGLEGINRDVVAWLWLPAVDISYPVLQGEDNEYYLHRSIEKEYLFAGSVFMDNYNSPGLENYNTIIYGHNMRDGSMFARLKDYNDPQTLESCPYFWLYTPERDYLYRVFSVHTAGSGGDTYTVRFADAKSRTKWLEKMRESSAIETGVELKQEYRVVTLSTCTGDSSVRQVVQGILVWEGR